MTVLVPLVSVKISPLSVCLFPAWHFELLFKWQNQARVVDLSGGAQPEKPQVWLLFFTKTNTVKGSAGGGWEPFRDNTVKMCNLTSQCYCFKESALLGSQLIGSLGPCPLVADRQADGPCNIHQIHPEIHCYNVIQLQFSRWIRLNLCLKCTADGQ